MQNFIPLIPIGAIGGTCDEIPVPGHIDRKIQRITADDIYDKTHTGVAFVV